MDAKEIKRQVLHNATANWWSGHKATTLQLKSVRTMLANILGRDEAADIARHQLLEHLFGKIHSGDLTKGEASALLEILTHDSGPVVVHLLLKAWGYEHGPLQLL